MNTKVAALGIWAAAEIDHQNSLQFVFQVCISLFEVHLALQ